MKAISFAGFTGFVDRYVNDTSSYASGRVLMVSIYGQLTAVRAIASALVLRENRKWDNGITLNDRYCYLESGASYRAITQRSDRRAFGVPTRITLIHERCTIKMINDPLFYILSPGKLSNLEENARERLRIASHLAITAEDAAWLWQDGQAQNTEFLDDDDRYFRKGALITEIEGAGCYAYRVSAETPLVAQLMREHLGLCIKPTWKRTLKGYSIKDDPRYPDFHFEFTADRQLVLTYQGKQIAQSENANLAVSLKKVGAQAGLWVIPEAK